MYCFGDLAYSEHEETEMLAVFTYANELRFEPGLSSPEVICHSEGHIKTLTLIW